MRRMRSVAAAVLAVVFVLPALTGCGTSIDGNGIHFNTSSHADHPDKEPQLNGNWEMRSYKVTDSNGQKITIDPNFNSTLTFADGLLTNNQQRTHDWEMERVNYTVSDSPDSNGYYTITFAPNGQSKPKKPAIYTYEIVHVKNDGIRFRPVIDTAKGTAQESMRDLIGHGARENGDYYDYDYYAACPWFQGFEEKIPSACAITPKTGEISQVGNATIYPAEPAS